MTPDELAAIEARADAATPGPWAVEEDGNWVYSKGGELADIYGGETTLDAATFIAAARQDVPALVDEVRRLWPLADLGQKILTGDDGGVVMVRGNELVVDVRLALSHAEQAQVRAILDARRSSEVPS